jgi:hypothetical protein
MVCLSPHPCLLVPVRVHASFEVYKAYLAGWLLPSRLAPRAREYYYRAFSARLFANEMLGITTQFLLKLKHRVLLRGQTSVRECQTNTKLRRGLTLQKKIEEVLGLLCEVSDFA